jgi:type IX secretion system PorP/SprF family membrane protein
MRPIILSFIVLCSIFGNLTAQQLPNHYGIDANAFVWNPALAGRFNYRSFGVSYNQPWSGFEGAPKQLQAFAESPIKPFRLSAGLSVGREFSNTYDRTDVTLATNYKLRFGYRDKMHLAIGLSIRWEQMQLSIDNPVVNDPDDPLIGLTRDIYSRFNSGVGLFFATNDDYYKETIYFAGLAAFPVIPGGLGSEVQLYRPAIHGSAMAGASIKLNNSDWFVEPVLWVDYSQPAQLYPQAYVKLERDMYYWVRLHLTTNSAALGAGYMLQIGEFMDVRIGATYRYWFGSISQVNQGGMDGDVILKEQLPIQYY